MRTLITACTLFLAVGLFAPEAALAQPVVSKEVKRKAQQAYDKGARAYRRNKFQEAVEHFLQAYETWPRRELRFNIALSYGKLGDKINAVINLRLFIKDASDKELASIPKWLRDIQDEVAVVNVQGPAGSVVSMDGKNVGEVPVELVILPGMHLFVVEREGRRIATRDWDVQPGLKRVWEVTEERPRPRAVVVRPPPPLPPPPPPPPPKRGIPKIYAITAAAVTVALAAAAAGLGGYAQKLHDDYRAHPTVDTRQKGLDLVTTTNAMWGVTAGFGVTAVVLAIFTQWKRPKERAAGVGIDLQPGGARITYGGSF
jgi:hypothetical protein